MQLERSALSRHNLLWLSFRALTALVVSCAALAGQPASAQTIDRIAESNRIRLGYLVDAAPFTYRSDAGAVEGYATVLCEQIAEQVRSELGLAELTVEWLPVSVNDRLRDVQQGRIDLLCAPMNVTIARRQEVSFSIPVFLGGTRAVLREDAPAQLRAVLTGERPTRPVWRGSPAATVLQEQAFAVVSGTTTESWIADRLSLFHIDAEVVTVPDYRAALQALADGSVDVVFGERNLIVEGMHALGRRDFVILDRLFTQEQAALALTREDVDFRLLVDAALSRLYRSEAFPELYIQWFGDMDDTSRSFFQQNALPE